jgi:hypothetical protein
MKKFFALVVFAVAAGFRRFRRFPPKRKRKHKIHLLMPEIDGQTVIFRWRVEPMTALYRRSSFRLTFPAAVDLSRVPARLWCDILLICLHTHWLLLRPCEVHLPLILSEPEKRFWLELLQNAADTLESLRWQPSDAHLPLILSEAEKRFWLQLLQNVADTLESLRRRMRPAVPLGIQLIDGALQVPHEMVDGVGYGTAFSSGKDSLLQAALLFELTERPLLVATTSPLPSLSDHETVRRREVFQAIQERSNPVFVEVVSDLRSSYDKDFSRKLYRIYVNVLTDPYLFMANLLAVGAALGRTRLFMASEAEVQENAEIAGRIVQHPDFSYSAATQRALARLLEPYGFRFGALTWPLYSTQVQRLLWARYPDLCDLQYSCWQVQPGQKTCSHCEQCLRIAMTALADGHNPERMGIDLDSVIAYAPEWARLEPAPPKPTRRISVAEHQRKLVGGMIKRTSVSQLAAIIARDQPSRLQMETTRRMLVRYQRLRKNFTALPDAPELGVREAFLDWLDPDLRDQLTAIYTSYFPREPRAEHSGVFERSGILTERARSKLDALTS